MAQPQGDSTTSSSEAAAAAAAVATRDTQDDSKGRYHGIH